MSQKKIDIKNKLAQSFKEQMLKHPFEKITIKMITDDAGVIRPTFYNYYQDKNAVFENILKEELFDPLYALVDIGMEREAIRMIFTYFGKNQEFYNRAFKTTGQNSFEEILVNMLTEFLFHIFDKRSKKINNSVKSLSNKDIAVYYTVGLVYVLKIWMLQNSNNDNSIDKIIDAYHFLVSHSLTDIFEID
ncbi:TetR/AcrR family transcriptional regulator [Paratissierella segnis]|jgi:probable dihydroxyacetone kinase regulator|uniref:TetR/AcrR family transcriptional regulator C-terminal domain-containing protein n=1 Tax=Paratissierella segnis TaxID=2763679 RepID=A0A926EVS5_9FIRM|nr:TetR/AcrR family transcriptional regulator [Paratissierella segnis]MBC8588516.1 TetR/AcrR family transcriptional regulator C-terminal domain-containing protein [Paratissierella segnis]